MGSANKQEGKRCHLTIGSSIGPSASGRPLSFHVRPFPVTEHRTRPIDRSLLFTELAAVCESLEKAGVREALVSFGWDSHLSIDKMWKDQTVSVQEIMSFVTSSEASGIATVGKSDIFVDTPGLKLTLCHDGDAHIKGDSPIVGQFVHRWGTLGYEPYEVQPRV